MPISQKLLEIQKAVTHIPKRGQMPGFGNNSGYDYHLAEDVFEGVRNAMIEHGVIFRAEAIDTRVDATGDMYWFTCSYRMTFIDPEDGSEDVSHWQTTGIMERPAKNGRTQNDKVAYSNHTGAVKSFLRARFLISDNLDDPDLEPSPEHASGERRGSSSSTIRTSGQSGKNYRGSSSSTTCTSSERTDSNPFAGLPSSQRGNQPVAEIMVTDDGRPPLPAQALSIMNQRVNKTSGATGQRWVDAWLEREPDLTYALLVDFLGCQHKVSEFEQTFADADRAIVRGLSRMLMDEAS